MRAFHKSALVGAALAVICLPAIALADVQSGSTTALTTQDKLYLTFSAQSSLTEIAGGQAAQTHSTNPMVIMFGDMMATDHGNQLSTETRVAATLDQTLPTAPDPVDAKILALSGQLHGSAFDCAYLTQEWTAHQNNVSMTRLEIASGSNAQVRAYALRYLHSLLIHANIAAHDLSALATCA